jgi:starch phosphorylase
LLKIVKAILQEWIQTIKNSIAKITPRFTMKRMLDDYIEKFYTKLATRVETLKADDFAKAKAMAAWKQKVSDLWDGIEVKTLSIPDKMISDPQVGVDYKISAEIDTKDASETGIGLELVVTYQDAKNSTRIYEVEEFELEKVNGSNLSFKVDYRLNTGGAYKFGVRMFPKHADLPYRQNFCYVRWI